jgi:non-ribosomal peptide synthetase component F
VVVALVLPRSLELIIALGAIARAGAAYLPLDCDNPRERLRLILDESQSACVLTLGELTGRVPTSVEHLILNSPALRRDLEELSGERLDPEVELLAPQNPLDASYVLYTSGSTGRPKGVVVPQRGILNRLRWMQSEYALVPNDKVLQKTPASFDVSVWEFFWPLLEGATLVVARL